MKERLNSHASKADPLHTNLHNAQKCSSTGGTGDLSTALHIVLAGGQDKDVCQCHERGKSAEKNPPWGEAGRSTMTDYFVMLRQVGEENTKDQKAEIGQIGQGFESVCVDNDYEDEKGDD